MPKPSVFRQAALDRLASPERLDELMQVTGPKAWLALSALGVLLLTLVGWGILGRINTRVEGQGILMGGDVYEVVPRWSGRVTTIHVGVGQEVATGQLVAELDQPELRQAIDNAEARIGDLQEEDAYLRTVAERESDMQNTYYSEQTANLERTIAEQESLLELVGAQLDREQQLFEQGHMPEAQLITAHEAHNSARTNLAASRAALTQIRLDELNADFTIQRRLIASEQNIHEAERALDQLENDLTLQSGVYSTYSGRVLEVVVDQGAVVTPGRSLMKISLIEGDAGSLRAIVFVGGIEAKRVRPDMVAQVAPSTVRPEEFGYMLGQVERVSEFPATPEGMRRVLKNDQLVQQMAAMGTVFEVHVKLTKDPGSTSGYGWTSGRGPAVTILDGTPATARIVIEHRRPVQVVIPALKRLFGLY
jgi:HlyD family secretion protein